jgi:hypothetical protein
MPLLTLPTHTHVPLFSALIDSGSSHCFIDTLFISKYEIPTYSVPPIHLRLFDGTSNAVIIQATDLPIRFPTGEVHSVTFYVTPLDSSCSLILGHN